MQIVNVGGLGGSSSFIAAVAQQVDSLFDLQQNKALASSPSQRVIVAKSSPSKTSQCALKNVDQLVVLLRAGAGSIPFLLRMFATVLEQVA